MFGNPLISNNPVDDIYSSQADTFGNSFGNPMNPANQGSGWGIDPSLLSPSYMAPYRPQYGGANGANNFGHPGFFGGLGKLSPFSDDVNWGNPIMHQQPAINDVSQRPFDAAMWGAQRIAAPIMAFGMANKALKAAGLGWKTGARFGSGLGGGFAGAFGANSSMGIRGTYGAVKGAYAANGFKGALSAVRGIGVGGGFNLAARGVMAGAFGAAAGVALPLAAGLAVMEGAERALFNPYINTMGSARSLRDNFGGITFGDMGGNSVTGKGLGFGESTRMAQSITSAGIHDMSFGTDEYRQGADMISRTGLLDNAKGSQISERIKENMKQVKLIMGIANMPEIKDAIEQLAKLQLSGASTIGGSFSTASATMGNIGRYASMAGTSVQRMMNNAGAQGQYLYQANGMTPYLGQLAAGASYSSFSAAQRMGLISTEQMARMGGLDGATQASLTGQINSSQTLYNKMAMYNSFLGGKGGTRAGYGQNQSAVDVVQGFGSAMAQDPLGVYGAMTLYGRQMAGKQMEQRGSLAVEDQIMSRAPKWLLDKNGKLSAERAVPFMSQMGMNEDQIQAFMNQRMSETDSEVYAANRRGMDANSSERIRQYISDTGTYGGAVGGAIYGARKMGRSFINGSKRMLVDPMTNMVGGMGDSVQNATDWAWFGASISNPSETIDDLMGTNKVANTSKFDMSRAGKLSGTHKTVANDINNLVDGGGQGAGLALDYLGDSSVAGRRKKLYNLINSGHLKSGFKNDYTSDYKDADKFIELDKSLSSVSKSSFKTEIDTSGSGLFSKELEGTSGLQVPDKFETLQDIGNAIGLATDKNLNVGNADELMGKNDALKRFAFRRGIKGGAEALAAAQKVAIRARTTGIDGLATVADSLNVKNYKNGDAALREAFEINGGAHKNGMEHAKDISTEEALGMSAEVRQDSLMKKQLFQLNKEGRLDFTSMRQAVTQIDNTKAVRDFQKAVDKFAGAVNKDSKNSTGPELSMSEKFRNSTLGKALTSPNQKVTTKG
jgi:hypothetical protein